MQRAEEHSMKGPAPQWCTLAWEIMLWTPLTGDHAQCVWRCLVCLLVIWWQKMGSGPNGHKLFGQPIEHWPEYNFPWRISLHVCKRKQVALKEAAACCSVAFPSIMCHMRAYTLRVLPSWDLLNIRLGQNVSCDTDCNCGVFVCVCVRAREEVKTWMCFHQLWISTVCV